MQTFIDDNFLLYNKTAQALYHDYARDMPIIDYHNHLSPAQIADDGNFENLTQVWLYGDHYKWRAMRTNGVNEKYITGDASDYEKFEQWAATVPYTIRNPLYHWTHLELQRYFGVRKLLSPVTAKEIYEECSEKLRSPGYSVRNLLRRMNVQVLCTTDDPIDDLANHRKISTDGFEIRVLPAFRPDKAMDAANTTLFNQYVNKLQQVTGTVIGTWTDYLHALKTRHDFFASQGCCLSDHGLERIYAASYTGSEIEEIFAKLCDEETLTKKEHEKFRSAMLVKFAEWDHEKNWVQQFHLGALRNNNSRMAKTLGADTGWDSIGDFSQAESLSRFLDRMDSSDQLAKTILYNLNPTNNELFASMAGNFNDGSVAGKIQFGSAWWFLDQKDGMTKQLNTLSNMGLLAKFIGMLTDSRSFMSYPRHEYFRRILCNLLGEEMEKGELPDDTPWIGQLVQDICYNNAKNYFGW